MRNVPGLMAWARKQNALRVHEKQSKLDEQQRQKQCDEAMRKHENASLAASDSLGSGGNQSGLLMT